MTDASHKQRTPPSTSFVTGHKAENASMNEQARPFYSVIIFKNNS
jgi:hypothetical protein